MLIEFTVGNYRSIREPQCISFVPSAAQEHETTHVFDPKTPGVDRLLRSLVLYGANAAGKSNLLRAIDAMQDIVLLNSQEGQPLPTTPFLLDEHAAQPSFFEIVFISNSVKYQYGFRCTREEIIEEWLFAFPEKRAQKWFLREKTEGGDTAWHFGPALRGPKKSWADATRDNALFLATAVQLKSEQLSPIFLWFKNKLRPVAGSGVISNDFSMDLVGIDAGPIAKLLRLADAGIQDLEVFNKDPGEIYRDFASKALAEPLREKVLASLSKAVRAKHKSSSGDDVWFDMDDESEGTKKLFACAGPLMDVMSNGLVLVIDELNNSLHPVMVKAIVNTFNSEKSNPNNAQILFATHATSILSTETFRRDQIWFAEKSKDGATSIYPLTDFSPRKEASLANGYLRGRFGAIPFIAGGNIL